MSAIDAMPARWVARSWNSTRHASSKMHGGTSAEITPVSIPWWRAVTNSGKLRPTKSKAAIREFQWSSRVEGIEGILGMRNDDESTLCLHHVRVPGNSLRPVWTEHSIEEGKPVNDWQWKNETVCFSDKRDGLEKKEERMSLQSWILSKMHGMEMWGNTCGNASTSSSNNITLSNRRREI